MAKKKVTARAKTSSAKLPAGFKAISGYGNTWPGDKPKVGASLQGKITELRSVLQERDRGGKKVKEKVGIATITRADGEAFNVWESAGTAPLFKLKKNAEVFIRYDGLGAKVKGKNQMKLYTVAAKGK